MRSGAMKLFREFAVCTVSPPVVLTTTPIWVSSQPAHGPWANGKPPSELQCHWRKSPCDGGFNLRLALAWQSSCVFFCLWLYARMRAKASPAVLGWLFPKEGGIWGRAKESIVCGMWIVVGTTRARRAAAGSTAGRETDSGRWC